MDTQMRWSRVWIAGAVLGVALGLDWLISRHRPSEFIFLVCLLVVLGEMIQEGFEAIWKRLNEIADTVCHDKVAGTEP